MTTDDLIALYRPVGASELETEDLAEFNLNIAGIIKVAAEFKS